LRHTMATRHSGTCRLPRYNAWEYGLNHSGHTHDTRHPQFLYSRKTAQVYFLSLLPEACSAGDKEVLLNNASLFPEKAEKVLPEQRLSEDAWKPRHEF